MAPRAGLPIGNDLIEASDNRCREPLRFSGSLVYPPLVPEFYKKFSRLETREPLNHWNH